MNCPKDDGPIVTQVHWINEWPQVKTVVQTEIRAGRQVYVITPLIRESENWTFPARRKRSNGCESSCPIPRSDFYMDACRAMRKNG